VRWFKTVRAILPLLALAAFWWARPDDFAPLLQTGIPINLGSADQPRQLFVPAAAILAAPLALRFGLPLILKAALLLPFAATALTHRSMRGPTFDPARDLSGDSFTANSQEDAAVEKAIVAALVARGLDPDAQPPNSGKVGVRGELQSPIRPFGHRNAAA
jgi:hypothetical protein